MKKITALLLCIAILLSMTACASGKSAGATKTDQAQAETKSDGKKIKIGYTFPGLTSAGLLGDCKAILDLAA